MRAAGLALAALGIAGCQHIGPGTILTDRVSYNEALAASWQEQTLLNIVKLRYADTPFFVDVAQITSGYSKTRSGNANLSLAAGLSPDLQIGERLGGLVGYQTAVEDRPTISYTPQTGGDFIRHLSAPIPPKTVLFLMQSGYDAELLLDLLVDSV